MATENVQPKSTLKRDFEGVVVQNSADKTINVKVDTTKMHAKYQKQYVSTKKFLVHDEKNQAQIGDTVSFVECRPYSKQKRWTLKAIVKAVA